MRKRKKDPKTWEEAHRRCRWALAHRNVKEARAMAWWCRAFKGYTHCYRFRGKRFQMPMEPIREETVGWKSRKGLTAKKKGDRHENLTQREFNDLGHCKAYSRRIDEARAIKVGADVEVIDGYKQLDLLIQCKAGKTISIPAAWKEILGALANKGGHCPIVRATFERISRDDVWVPGMDLAIGRWSDLDPTDRSGILFSSPTAFFGQTYEDRSQIPFRDVWQKAVLSPTVVKNHLLPIIRFNYKGRQLLGACHWDVFLACWNRTRKRLGADLNARIKILRVKPPKGEIIHLQIFNEQYNQYERTHTACGRNLTGGWQVVTVGDRICKWCDKTVQSRGLTYDRDTIESP